MTLPPRVMTNAFDDFGFTTQLRAFLDDYFQFDEDPWVWPVDGQWNGHYYQDAWTPLVIVGRTPYKGDGTSSATITYRIIDTDGNSREIPDPNHNQSYLGLNEQLDVEISDMIEGTRVSFSVLLREAR